MVVHFTTSRESVVQDIVIMRKIIALIYESGSVLARDWIEPFYILAKKKPKNQDREDAFKLNVEAIERADLVIVEGSRSSFGSGFQLAQALQKKKPVLLLVKKTSVASESSVSRSIEDSCLRREEYDLENLEEIVRNFISENTVSTKDLRFNFVIDRQIYSHLRVRSYELGKTKAEIVRDLLLEDIEKRPRRQ